MQPPIGRLEWQPDSKFLERIYSGYRAEQKYNQKQRSWAEDRAQHHFRIPIKDVPSLVKRALGAAINTLRHARDPKPNLLKRMLQDQVTVYLFQKKLYPLERKKIRKDKEEDPLKRYREVAQNYTRRHMGLFCQGHLSISQETVCENATNDFLMQILKPSFTLTTSLTTYLIGILKRQIFSSGRPELSKDPFLNKQVEELTISAEALIYFQQVHRVIAKHLSQMKDTCLKMTLRHYNIDPMLVDTVSELPTIEQTLSIAEFRERFAIGMKQPTPSETIKTIAKELGIDPRQASREHLTCLDELVLNVTNELFSDSAMPLPTALKTVLQTRIDEARQRRQGTKSKK